MLSTKESILKRINLETIKNFTKSLIDHSKSKMQDIFVENSNTNLNIFTYNTDILKLISVIKNERLSNLDENQLKNLLKDLISPSKIAYYNTDDQVKKIKSYVEKYGSTNDGLARIITRVFLKQFFRNYEELNNNIQEQKTSKQKVIHRTVDRRLQES